MRTFYFLLIFLLLSFRSLGQQPAYFMFAQEQFEGIDIYNIIQDQEHNYWFATDQGIYFHDGYTFEKVESPKMRSNSVFNFVINSEGVVYCSNLNQQVFQLKEKKCELVFTIPDKGFDITLIVNNEDELYISTSRKVYVLNSKNKLINRFSSHEESMIAPPFLYKDGSVLQHFINETRLLIYKDGAFKTIELSGYTLHSQMDDLLQFFHLGARSYAVNQRENLLFELDEESLKLRSRKPMNSEASGSISRYYITSQNLWLANSVSGVHVYGAGLKSLFNDQLLFTDYLISHVYEDHEGNILLATFDQGIIVIPTLKNLDVDATFNGISVNRILCGNAKDLFLGARDGSVFRYSGDLNMLSSASNKGIEALFYWQERKILFDDSKNLRLIDLNSGEEKSLTMGSLKDAVSIDNLRVLMAFNSGVYYVTYEPTKKTFVKSVTLSTERGYAVNFEKATQCVYFSTSSGLYYSKNGIAPKSISYKGESISALDIEVYGDLTYAATAKQGVLVLKNGRIHHQFHPIYNGKKLSLFKIKRHKNKLYANTQIGLVIISLDGHVLYHLNKSAGLSANKIVDFEIHNDELWIAHIRGIQRMKLSNFTQESFAPSVRLKRILVNTKDCLKTTTHFDHTARRFEFEFSVYTLKNRENIKYWYKLVGVDQEWSVNSYEDNKVLYNALGSGRYTLLVKTENNGVFSDKISYSFTIATPFYQQWWFWSIIVLLGIGIVTLIYRRKLHIQQKKADQRNELNASKLTAIQSQMNPHFIFNSLNSIQDLVLKGDVDNSYTFITTFSNLVRRTLNYSDKDFIDFEQEIKLIELYLSLEKLRFKDTLLIEIDTQNIGDIQIPPMLVQPFIENALVHGLLHKEGIKKLQLNFELKDALYCEIIDNGIGRKKAQEIRKRQRGDHKSFAMNAIKTRFDILSEHFNKELGFEYQDIMDGENVVGTKVTLRIPIQRNY